MAAILHDSAKELPKQELLQIFADNAIIAENAPARPSPVWHGIAAAILAETQWGITDPEIFFCLPSAAILPASRGMSKLDKIIYLADMTSAERDWPRRRRPARAGKCRIWTGPFATHSSAA